jgi:hypothetical protein
MPSPREGGGRGEAEMGMSGGRHPPRGGAPIAEGRRRPRRGGQRQSGQHPPRRRPLRQVTQKEGGSSCSPPSRRELASASASGPPSSRGLAVEVEQLAVATEPPPPRAMEPCCRRIGRSAHARLSTPSSCLRRCGGGCRGWRRRQPPGEEEAPPDPSRPRVRRRAQRLRQVARWGRGRAHHRLDPWSSHLCRCSPRALDVIAAAHRDRRCRGSFLEEMAEAERRPRARRSSLAGGLPCVRETASFSERSCTRQPEGGG